VLCGHHDTVTCATIVTELDMAVSGAKVTSLSYHFYYFASLAPKMGAKHCSQHVCLSFHISHVQTSPNCLCMLPVTVARSCSDDSVHYILPVLWMTSCFHIMGQIRAWSLQCSELFSVTRQVAPLNCAPGGSLLLLIALFMYVYNLR